MSGADILRGEIVKLIADTRALNPRHRLTDEQAAQRILQGLGRAPIHPPADDQFTYRAGGASGITFAIDVSGTPVIHYPGGTATISDLREFIASVLVLRAALADREAHR